MGLNRGRAYGGLEMGLWKASWSPLGFRGLEEAVR